MKAPPERDVDGKTVIVLQMKPSRAGPLIMVTQDFADRSEPRVGAERAYLSQIEARFQGR